MAALTEEQTMLRDQAKAWAIEQAPVTAFRKMRDADVPNRFEPQTWQAMVDMGWTGILVPEQYGGSDLGYLTFGVVLEELGRQLTASPLLASALIGASAVILGGSDEQKQAILPGVVDGSQILTLAVDEGAHHAPEQTALKASADGDGYLLSGAKTAVLEGMAATSAIVVARTSGAPGSIDGISLFIVPLDADGASRSAIDAIDSRGYATLSFDNVRVASGALLGELDKGGALLTSVLDRARAGLCAEMTGTAAQAFDMTLEYLKTREQFGSVIGAFQALGHRAAELFSEMELARSCGEAALQTIDAGADPHSVAEMTSLAKCRVGEFLFHMSNELIQMHGGIGMTDEFDAGLYLKRARALEPLFGNRAYHRDRFATANGF